MSSVLRKKQALLKLKMLSGFKDFKKDNIKEIPKERTLFPDTKNDYWHEVVFPYLDCSACVYELEKGCSISPHFHENHAEQLVMLTPNGVVEIITLEDYKSISYPDNFLFKKGETHAVVNKSDFKIKLLLIWTPKMDGFQITNKNIK